MTHIDIAIIMSPFTRVLDNAVHGKSGNIDFISQNIIWNHLQVKTLAISNQLRNHVRSSCTT